MLVRIEYTPPLCDPIHLLIGIRVFVLTLNSNIGYSENLGYPAYTINADMIRY